MEGSQEFAPSDRAAAAAAATAEEESDELGAQDASTVSGVPVTEQAGLPAAYGIPPSAAGTYAGGTDLQLLSRACSDKSCFSAV